MTYNVFGGTLSLTQSINQLSNLRKYHHKSYIAKKLDCLDYISVADTRV